ncbi:MAG: hypothetical protein HFE86_04670 [Clostridiales bacterium]|nr:hypothetical protein [Clostridiales bacterium]
MKSKFRKINRGLILSLLVVLGVVAYYVVLGIQAAPEKKLMNETLTGYFEELAPAHIVPEQYKTASVTKADVEKLAAETKEKFKPYFADQKSLDVFMENTIIPALESQTIYPSQEVVEARSDYQKIVEASIDRENNTATVTAKIKHGSEIKYYEVSYEADGSIHKRPAGSSNSGGYDWETDVSFTMQKVEGKWLITGTSGYWM